MYSEVERQNTLDKLVSVCKSIADVDGLILVGSGACGFTDKWSDIDLSVAVCEEERTRAVWDKLNENILSMFDTLRVSYHQYSSDSFLSAIFLNNFLEIDIGVISVGKLSAKRKEWHVLYDRTGIVSEKMNDTWENRKMPDCNAAVENSLRSIWYHIKNGAFALKRERLYRAAKEIEAIRNEIVEIKALQGNKIAKHFRDVDDMDCPFLERLAGTFPKEVTIDGLTKAFVNSFVLYFDVAKDSNYNHEKIIKYELRLRELLRELDLV